MDSMRTGIQQHCVLYRHVNAFGIIKHSWTHEGVEPADNQKKWTAPELNIKAKGLNT